MFVGYSHDYSAQILFMAFAVVACVLFIIQVTSLQKLFLLPVFLLPILSFCVCFENIILFLGNGVDSNSEVAAAANVFHALEIPLFVICLYEISFRLHEARSAHFFCIPLDQGPNVTNLVAILFLWLVRLLAACLFILNILVDFKFVSYDDVPLVGQGGYPYLALHSTSTALWLALIPPIVLTFVGLQIGLVSTR